MLLVSIVGLTGCGPATPLQPIITYTPANTTTPAPVITPSANPVTITPANTPTLSPWPNLEVFNDETQTINVIVGQEFVISYFQFTSSNIDFQPTNIVVVESKQFVQNPGVIIPDGMTWILFKAVASGSTNVSVTETTRFGDPLQTKTFAINVGPAAPNPVSVVSVTMTGPINPGGPVVEITLKNVSSQPVISLDATLILTQPVRATPPGGFPQQGGGPHPFIVTFPTPILPGTSASAMILIGGGYGTDTLYLAISCTTQDGQNFSFTQQVKVQ